MEKNIPTIHVPRDFARLPDGDQWENRFTIRSESSSNMYVVAQNIKKRHWACDCPGWKRHRKCKHLAAIGLPAHEVPYEAKLSQ